jgi:mevalonate kinase
MVGSHSASAPGSLMLLGEHAVLHGYPCLVAAIDRRVRVELTPRRDGELTIQSALGFLSARRDAHPENPSFRFVLGALRHLPAAYADGLDIHISADMPPTIGFGTSAAVTVAMVAALTGSSDKSFILQNARAIIQNVQGRGSGADVAASTYGGVVHYRMNDTAATVISTSPHPVTAIYCGYKTPTPEVIARVDALWKDKPAERDALYTRMGELAAGGIAEGFVQRLIEGQSLMQQLGVSTPELDQCVELLRNDPGIGGAKISGSGLGDCAIGWGDIRQDVRLPDSFEIYRLKIDPSGVRFE